MITHVVLFRWKPDFGADDLVAVAAALDALPPAIDVIRSFRHGADVGASTTPNYDYGVVATFDDVDGWREYDQHPVHDRLRAEVIRPLIAERAGVQFSN